MANEDRGPGDEAMFPAEDLERLYRQGARTPIKILGKELNKILHTTRYVASRWYVVTETGVTRL